MSSKVVLIDLLAPKGHINFVKKLINILTQSYDVVLISSQSFCKEIGHNNTIELNDKLFDFKNKHLLIFQQIRIIKKIKKIIKKNNLIDNIIITSFENISFLLTWEKKAYAFIHNNLEKNKLNHFLFSKISNKVIFSVFENYIAEYVGKEFKKKCIVIPHPLNFKPNDTFQLNNNYIFSPSGGTSLEKEIEGLITFSKKNGLKILVKSNDYSKNSDLITAKKYFNNYKQILKNAHSIFIANNYDYRISGVFYEAMSYNKIIIINNPGKFLKSMKEKYSNSVFTYDSYINNNSNELKDQDFEKFIFESCDEIILEKFNKIFL